MQKPPRIHLATPLQAGLSIMPDPQVVHYLTRVLRLKEGAEVHLFDGLGGHFTAHLRLDGKGGTVLEMGPALPGMPESPLSITLIQGIAKGTAMEWVIQKSTELGVTTLIPLSCARSVPRPKGGREGKENRWQRIATEAAEQCGRIRVPYIHEPVSWDGLASLLPATGPRFLFWEASPPVPWPALATPREATLLIGPEGGLSLAEVTRAGAQWGFQPLSLGPRILRTESAALAAVALLQALWGDLGGGSAS